MWFDSHCHLHLCARPVDEVLSTATAAGVEGLVTVGIDLPSSREAVALSGGKVRASVGVHPNSAEEWQASRGEIEELVQHPDVVAVGESGLDFYRDLTPRDAQAAAFRDHIELAKQHDKALVIHTRSSVDAALDVLDDSGPPPRVVFHCWSGDSAQLDRALALGAFVSFAGNVSFRNAPDLRARAASVPADRLLVETDSPFLSPTPHRGRPNEPAHVADVGRAVAEARSEDAEAVATRTTENAVRLFRL